MRSYIYKKKFEYLFIIPTLMILILTTNCFADTKTLHLKWNQPSYGSEVNGYYIYYGSVNYVNTDEIIKNMSVIDTGSNATTYSISGLQCDLVYYIYVRAYNSYGTGPLSEVKIVGQTIDKIRGFKIK